MTSYTMRFSGPDADEQAITETARYLGPDRWQKLTEMYFSVEPGHHIPLSAAKKWIKSLQFACMMIGVQGYPVRALCRKFLAQFEGRK